MIKTKPLIPTTLRRPLKKVSHGKKRTHRSVEGTIVDEFFARNQVTANLRTRILTPFRQHLRQLVTNPKDRYNVLKRQFRIVNRVIHENTSLTDKQIQALVNLVQDNYGFQASLANILQSPSSESQSFSFASIVKNWRSTDTSGPPISYSLDHMDDITFMREMTTEAELQPVYCDVAAEIKSLLVAALQRKLKRIGGDAIQMLRDSLLQNVETQINRHFTDRQLREEGISWQTLRVVMQKALSSSNSSSRSVRLNFPLKVLIPLGRKRLLIRSVERVSPSTWFTNRTGRCHYAGIAHS